MDDDGVVHAVVALDGGVDGFRRGGGDVHLAFAAQPQGFGADVVPGGGADAGVGIDQIHVLADTRIHAFALCLVGFAVHKGDGVAAELDGRVVNIVGGSLDVDVLVAQTGGTVGSVDRLVLIDRPLTELLITDVLGFPLFVAGLLAGIVELLFGVGFQPVFGVPHLFAVA